MVAQQVLRIAICLSTAALASWPRPSSADDVRRTGEPVIIIDLRPTTAAQGRSLAALTRGLREDPRVRVTPKNKTGAQAPAWKAFVDRAGKALADLDCSQARTQSLAAITALATEHALGKPVREPLTRAYGIWLRCAEPADAQLIIQRLRNLGHQSAPKGVSPDEWNKAPAIDAQTGVIVAATDITTEPAGAKVFVDHKPVGTSPIKLALAPGRHLITAIAGSRGASERVDAKPPEGKLTIQLPPARPAVKSDPIAEAEQSWRGRSKALSATEVGKLLRATGKRVALIAVTSGQVQIWALPKDTRFARRVSAAPTNNPKYVAKLVNEWVQAEDGAGIDPSFPLLREDPNQRKDKKKGGRSTEWWVYAGVGAAVTFASILILADQFADDRQRIELTLP
ncbi:MAG: PEGA domain-containing protein [Deltaproteobacteria bacterium]|nr:PEGA domain-containing protein [Deltaproteobacteria bacterium]